MSDVAANDQFLTCELVTRLAEQYLRGYDDSQYDENIEKGRSGDQTALLRLTEWKNPGSNGKPMRLSERKEKSLAFLMAHLQRGINDSNAFRNLFSQRAPVYSLFWHHVLYETPIFDVYTNAAFVYFSTGEVLQKQAAKIRIPTHWSLYDKYSEWFNAQLSSLRIEQPTLTSRNLDRALFEWGRTYSNSRQKAGEKMCGLPLP